MKDTKNNNIQDRVKICHITIQLNTPGGAERVMMQMLLNNPSSIPNKMVIVLCRAGDWGQQLRAAGITVHELGMESILDVPKIFFLLKKRIREFNPDIVQTWMYHSDFLGGLAAFFSGYKNIIWGIHRTALAASDPKSTRMIMKFCAFMSRWVPKKIISVAEAGKKAHVAAGYDASKVIVIPNGFDFSKLTATQKQRETFRKACEFAENEIVIGCLGRFHKVKGQDNFVKAAVLIVNKNPSKNIKFLMVGSDCDANNSQLMSWIHQFKLEDRIVLLGQRDDVAVCLSGMDVFCMPSQTEGFPLCLGEAMAMGLPCVATDVGDAGFLAGGTVKLVPPQNEEALAEALLQVISLPKQELGDMGERAKTRVLTEFTIESIGERYDAIYQELMPGRV